MVDDIPNQCRFAFDIVLEEDKVQIIHDVNQRLPKLQRWKIEWVSHIAHINDLFWSYLVVLFHIHLEGSFKQIDEFPDHRWTYMGQVADGQKDTHILCGERELFSSIVGKLSDILLP